MYLTDVYSTVANVVGIPGLAFPVDFHEGLPVGVQLLAAPFNETILFRLGACIESQVDIPRLWEGEAVS
jgi:aspartyl-tRNA(Asn)/glutamyl-tRNA(Gln) amidotransferase subunit A